MTRDQLLSTTAPPEPWTPGSYSIWETPAEKRARGLSWKRIYHDAMTNNVRFDDAERDQVLE